jgi:hypothetical protein
MSETLKPSYAVGFEALLEVFKQASKQCPKGIGLKRDLKNGKNYLLFNLTLPSGKRVTKPTGEDFDESGFWLAVSKAAKIAQKIKEIPEDESFLAGLTLYQNRPDKEYSLIDCISMQTMRELEIIDILTHDKHFTQEGFVILL